MTEVTKAYERPTVSYPYEALAIRSELSAATLQDEKQVKEAYQAVSAADKNPHTLLILPPIKSQG